MKAPFPWFGGKRRVAPIVWARFGDVPNYVEPFFGSGAVLLDRPHAPRCETVNDKDCYLSNFWRAIQADGPAVARYADWPVNEADLHARHKWLVNRAKFRERMLTDPHYYDPKVAGWWVWGLSQWIGGEWCAIRERPYRRKPKLRRGGNFSTWRKRPNVKRGGVGVHAQNIWMRRPNIQSGGKGVHRQLPDLNGDSGAYGRGVHAVGLDDKTGGIYLYFSMLQERLRRARVCCGEWDRVLSYSPTTAIGTTAVLLDPPYSKSAGRDSSIYSKEDLNIAHAVADWARQNGDNPEMRIALCGYEGEHDMPDTWEKFEWQSNGGYSNRAASPGVLKNNRSKERIWFSPHCLKANQDDLFAAVK